MKKLLNGLKVLDLSRLLPGPLCSLYFADLGATVLKIEDPSTGGDYLRSMEPKLRHNSQGFCHVNRNKKSVTLDLRTKEGVEIFLKLVKQYDVVLESFRPGVMAKLGLEYNILKKTNPKIILCSITGYGQTGPLKDEAGHDLNFVSYAGILDPGTSEAPPPIPQFQTGDLAGGGLTAAFSVLAAYIGVQKGQDGCHIDVSMFDGIMALTPINLAVSLMKDKTDYFLSGQSPCYQIYKTKDGKFMSLAAVEKKFWIRFLELCKRPDLEPLHMAEGKNKEHLKVELTNLFESKTRSEWVGLLKRDNGTCCSPLLTYAEALSNEHVKARHLVKEENHPLEGKVTHLMFPVKFDNEDGEIFSSSPQMGEHNSEVLLSLGYSSDQIKKFQEDSII